MESTNSIPQELGDFEIIRELGRGGMGIVYEARQKSLNRRVALKVLSSGLGLTAKAVMRFRREAEAAAKLHHTNIVPIYSTGEDHGVHYYAMELIDGPSLDQVIRHMREVDEPESTVNDAEKSDRNESSEHLPDWVDETIAFEGQTPGNSSKSISTAAAGLSGSSVASGTKYFDAVATMIADVADALDHAHDQGVIHRDIKPSNLLLGPDGRLSINDFGLARVLEQPGMTMSGEFVGSPLYMSPEQITAGRTPLDHRTDIFSLGATLYELLTLQPPFAGRSRDEVLSRILHKDAVPPRKLSRRIPIDLDTICMKAIEKDPDRRYQIADQLADDLRKHVNRYAISARRISPFGKVTRWVIRHPSWASLFLLMALMTVAGVVIWRANQARSLAHAKEMHLVYCMTGNFDAAAQQMRLAEALGATDGWLLLAEGQTKLYLGEYDHAFELLDEASRADGPTIPTRAIRTITLLYSGDERNHALDLRELSTALREGYLAASSPEDNLYLAMAFQYADPKESLEYLAKADTGLVSGRLHDVVRCVANMYAAANELDLEKAIEYAEFSQSAAKSIGGMFDESPLAVSAAIEAETVAGICFRRANAKDRSERAFATAARLVGMVNRFPQAADSYMSTYLLMDETEQVDKVTAYLEELPDDQIDHYTRTYRMIDCVRLGHAEQASRDMSAFKHDGDFKYPFVVLAHLSNNPDEIQRESIEKNLRGKLRQALRDSADDVFHIEFFWAACRLLEMHDEARMCEREIAARAAKYDGLYVGETMRPIEELVAGISAREILANANGRSRRRLTYSLFALGIDSLARGRKKNAQDYFDRCAKDGVNVFYVCQMSRALMAICESDPEWPQWIESAENRPSDSTAR